MVNLKLTPYLSSYFHSISNLPTKWVNDIKHLEFSELLSSSISVLALIYNWKKKEKDEFVEIASGTLSSSFVYGDPLTSIASIAVLANAYHKTKNKNILRKYKWASIRGFAGVGAFALSTKLISIPLLNILIGIIAAYTVKNVVKSLRLFEYLNYLRTLKFYLPYIKKEISRRDFLKLDIFAFKAV